VNTNNDGPLVRGHRNGWDVVSVSPPSADLRGAGKSVASLVNGRWVETKHWQSREFSEEELAAADNAGANVGIRFSSGNYFAFDVDFTDREAATKVHEMLSRFDDGAFLGSIYRVGQPPKFALILSTIESYLRTQISLTWDRNGTLRGKRFHQRVDLFGGSGQIVVHGIHPKTGEPYRCFAFDNSSPAKWWPVDIFEKRPSEILRPITTHQIVGTINSIATIMREAAWGEARIRLGSRPTIRGRKIRKKLQRILRQLRCGADRKDLPSHRATQRREILDHICLRIIEGPPLLRTLP